MCVKTHTVLLWACDSKMIRYIAILLILSNQVKSDIMDKRIAVVAFQPKVSISHEFLTEDVNKGFYSSKDLTVCFRYMTRFISDLDYILLIETIQFRLGVYKNYGVVFLRPFNSTVSNDEYRRVYRFCKSCEPGHWVSVCLRVTLHAKIQKISFFQDGGLCFYDKYLDGSFENMFFRNNVSLDDWLG